MAVDPIILEFRAETARLRKELQDLDKKLDGVGKEGDKAGKEISKGMDRAERKTKSVKKETNNLEKAFKTLATRLVAAFAVDQIVRFGAEAIKLAQTAKGVQTAFDNISGASIERLREATRGTVSDLELMKNAVQAQNLGVPIQELGNLFAFATQRARETGESVDFLTNSIVTGIGRKSPLILDNLGISAVALKEALGGVAVESASVAEVTQAVSRIIEGEMANAVDSGVNSSEQLSAAMENLQVVIGQKLTPAFNNATSSLADFVMAYTAGVKEMNTLNETLDRGFLRQIFDFPAEILLGIRDDLLKTQRGAQLFAQSAAEAAAAGRWDDAASDIEYLTEKLAGLEKGSDDYKIVLSALTTAQDAYNKALMAQIGIGLEVNEETTERIGILKQLKEEIKSINDQLENATSQSQINDLLDRRIAKEVQVNAILNQRKNLEDDGVDPELEMPTFANDPFGNFETEAERVTASAEKVFDDFYDELLQKQAEAAQKEIEWAEFVAEQQKEITNNKLQALSGFIGAIDELLVASGKNSKELATFQAFLNLYLAISNALAQPLDPIQKAIYVATLTAQAAAQIANIQSQQVPSFYTGTPFVSDSPSKGRKKDDVVANLHYGEAVIPAAANKRNKGLSAAWIKGHEDKWIHKNYVLPALKAHIENFNKQKEKDFASNMAASMAFNMPDDRIVRELKKTRTGQYALVDALTRSQRKNPYRA